ncbi:methionine ABC transporter ATP-binding protein [Undibacterium cyanobacteriorum]|uniref:Methionine ABC transporter ATP-binding protein n=1 Tax=Undibacterium cyanobacteriorum TaxID=3073561 RepID=A0ABY9RFD7_9BURK|nr:methionine ABC transporter ATP-binding protein [Undibacterium sp. 20NA77.5]WMW79940.1 methionine ABC transporter ATP-binding protein [Undibacterium sp. 20NA77.5]
MIHIEALEKNYGSGKQKVTALRGINLEIAQGEIFGIIGRSGAGKSSLIRTLNLLEKPSAGRVMIDGEDITQYSGEQLRQLRQQIGMVFQHFNLLSSKTVAQNIDFPLSLSGTYSKAEREQRVAELLELVGLQAHRDQYPAQLSGGQKQRVGIARALANHPKLLLCDEATSALDPETTQSILRLLLEINQKLGLTIVLITHEMQVIRTICDRVAVIEAGEIVETGPVVDVFLHPQHPVTQALVAENQALDLSLLRQMQAKPESELLRLTYVGAATHEPILHRIAAQSSAEIAVLQGVIARIKMTPYGQLIVELSGTEDEREKVKTLLREAQVRIDMINDLRGV